MARPKKVAEADSPEELKAATVRMVRHEPMFQGGPVTADVHPAEVGSMKDHDWKEA